MKRAIISPFGRINISGDSARSLDVIYLKRYLGDENTYIISKKLKEQDDNYLNIAGIESLNKFDEVYIHNFNTNFFGGVVPALANEFLRLIADYNGAVYYYITDPKLKYTNIAADILSRKSVKFEKEITREELQSYKKKLDFLELRMKILFTGYNYKPIYGLNEASVKKADIFGLMFQDKATEFTESEKFFDICYYGDNRGTYRNNKVKSFLNNTQISPLIIGLELPIEKATFLKKMKHSELGTNVAMCYGSLIVGDAEHENSIATFRFYEAINFNVVAFIDVAYDRNKMLFIDDTLKDFNYVSSSSELATKIAKLKNDPEFFKLIINKQKQHVWKMELSK